MPHTPMASNDAPEDDVQHVGPASSPEHEPQKRKKPLFGRFSRLGNWLKDSEAPPSQPAPTEEKKERDYQEEAVKQAEIKPARRPSLLGRRGHRGVVPELPRPGTFRRQNSEKRDRLLAVPTEPERRALSADRRPRDISRGRPTSSSPSFAAPPSLSAPDVGSPHRDSSSQAPLRAAAGDLVHGSAGWPEQLSSELPNPPPLDDAPPTLEEDDRSVVLDERELQAELESKWILNLSMRFRDKSEREKFFVTYAQELNHWRRVTVSLDYRDAQSGTVEADLKSLHYQRDKSARIYEAVRSSLPDIQFFDTVTNLKLQSDEDQRLHVHVTEDVNEIISYPSISLFEHVDCTRYTESEVEFDAHLSGFVYRVRVDDEVLIKKEIPGPDTIDEFLYEVNALDVLKDAKSVIKFHGLVVDEDSAHVKGLLISFAAKGSLVDMIFDYKDTDQLPWETRERWAYQIIEGLSEIHEAGYVQGDFTLSNIVIDGNDDAKIIDINRRGCPVGWEPPELISLIHSGQRIGMCIGVKSDLFQLGIVLWAIAEKNDMPENVERLDDRIPPISDLETPLWFTELVDLCLSSKPRDRPSAKELLRLFANKCRSGACQSESAEHGLNHSFSAHSVRSRRSEKRYIDPAAAVHLEDIEEHRRKNVPFPATSHMTSEPYTFLNAQDAASTNYQYPSDGSCVHANRERKIPVRGRTNSPHSGALSRATSVSSRSEEESRPRRRTYEYMCASGDVPSHGSMPAHSRCEPRSDKTTRFALDPCGIDKEDGDEKSEDDQATHHLRRQEGAYFSPPPHQDSGFDEQMVAGIEESHPPLPATHPGIAELEVDTDSTTEYNGLLSAPPANQEQPFVLHGPRPVLELATQQEGLDSTGQPLPAPSPNEPTTPFSYYTPLTTPLDDAAAHAIADNHLAFDEPAMNTMLDRDPPAAV